MHKITMLGAGLIGRFYTVSLQKLPGCEVSMVCAASEDEVKAFADEFGIPRWSTSIEAAINDPETDTVYYTPLYYVMSHFSKYIRPGAYRIDVQSDHDALMVTACQNPDGTIVLAVLNQGDESIAFQIQLGERFASVTIPNNALQTLVIQ